METGDDRYLSQNDAILWLMEADPLLRSTIVGIVVLDHAPDFASLAERMDQVTRQVPALRQKVVSPPLHPKMLRWVVDTDFDLDYHLRRISLPAPGSFDDLLEFARTNSLASFDRARPLWEFTLVEGVDEGAAFVMKAHHVVADGIGSVQLAAYLFDFETPDGTLDLPPLPAPDEAAMTRAELWRDVVGHNAADAAGLARRSMFAAAPFLLNAVRHPQETVQGTVETVRSVGRLVEPILDRLSPVMTERTLASDFNTVDVPLDELRAAARAAGGTLNDGFLAGITGGLRRYHRHHGVDVSDLRVAMPVSLRTDDHAAGGNHVTLLRFKVTVGIEDPAARIRALHDASARVRNERGVDYAEPIAGVLNLLPAGVLGTMLKNVDFLASNVPGVPVPMFLAGAEVRGFYPFGPTLGSAVNITLMSYRDTAHLGVHTDAAAIPDDSVFLDCLVEGFDEVLDLQPG